MLDFSRPRERQTLKYFVPVDIDSVSWPSMLKAFVGGINRILKARNIRHNQSQPRRSSLTGRVFNIVQPSWPDHLNFLQLNPRFCCFDRIPVRHTLLRGCTATLVRGAFSAGDLNIFYRM